LLKPIGGPTGVGWHRVQLNLLDEATEALQSELDFRVMPGNYALYYEFRGSSKEGAWPLNSRFRLDEQLSIDGDVTLPVEISTSVVTLDLRVDGVALAALPRLEGQVVEVRLEGGEGGVTLAHLEGGNPETSWILPTARLIPAGYQITWSNNLGSEGAPLPYGYSSALPLGSGSSGASLSVGDQDGNLLIDIETAEVTLALLQDGEAPSQVGFGAGDDPRVLLLPRGASAPQGMGAQQDHQPPSDGDGEGDYPNAPDPSLNPGGNSAVIAPPFWDLSSGTSSDSLVLRVLPGNYDVLYTHTASATDPLDGTERRWAHNGAMLDDNLTIYPGAEFEWNIESAVVEVDVLLDGAALSESLCTGGGAAIRMLWAQAFPGKMRTQWRLPDLCATDSGQPRTPYSIRLVVGSYDFHYSTSAGALGPAWPRHEAPVTLDVNRAVAADTTLDINIPVVELTLNITTTGTPPPSPGEEEEEDLNQWPHIELAELGMDAPQQLGWSRPASVALPLQSTLPPLLLIPSNYTIAYLARNTGLGPDWPNASYRVETAVLIDGDINLSYDLDTSRVGIELSLNGLPADLSNTGPGDHGKLTLVRADPQGTFNWVSPWRDEQLNTEPQLINLPSGHYQLLYYPAGYEHSQTISFETIDYGGGWPLSAGTYAGCIDVE
jgi:hypothetical protein